MSHPHHSNSGPRLTAPASAPVSIKLRQSEKAQPTLSAPALGEKAPSAPPLNELSDQHVPRLNPSEEQSTNQDTYEGPIDSEESLLPPPVPLSPEQRADRLRYLFKALAIVLSLLVVFLTHDALATLELFQLRSVHYSGLKQLDRESLDDHLRLEQIRPSLITPSLREIEERIEAHPWIKKADATLSPSGTINIAITEYRAAAIAVLDELYLVTPQGVPFAPARAADLNSDLPMISGVLAELFKQSKKSSLIGQYWLKRGIELADSVRASGLTQSHHLSDVHISETGRYEIILDKIRISLGTDLLVERLEKVKKLLARLDRKGVSAAYILLSDDLNRAIVKETAITPQEDVKRSPQ